MSSYIVLLSNDLDERNHFLTCSRIEPAGGFIEEQQLWTSNQLTCDTDAALLAPADTFTNGSADKRMLLLSKAERIEQAIDSAHTIRFRQAAIHNMS